MKSVKKDPRLRRRILRVALAIEKQGYRVSLCSGTLAQAFDILAESVYSSELDSGIFIKVQISEISEEALQAVLSYAVGERRKKEIWLVRFEGKKNAPGHASVFRFEDDKIVEHPSGLELSEVMSTGKKQRVKSLNEPDSVVSES